MSNAPQSPNLPVTGALVSLRNPFADRNPDEVWQELLSEPLQRISKEEAMRRMVEAAKKTP